MKDTAKKRSDGKRLSRAVRRIRAIVKTAFSYYSIAIAAFCLTLAILAGMFVLQSLGYQFTAKTDIILLAVLIFLCLVTMLGGIWGMLLLSLKRREEHVREYFSGDFRAGNPESVPAIPAEPRSRIRLEGHSQTGADVVFTLAALVFWLGGDWLVRRWLGERVPPALDGATLFVTWFPALRLTRWIRGGYERILFGRRPRLLRNRDGKEGRQHEQAE